MSKTVFFGPFIGEFGWELLFWQGWVRKVCRNEFRDHHRIACSVPGRTPFYPYVDEFMPIPQSFLDLKVSGHGYYADGWRAGYPGKQVERYQLGAVLRSLARARRPYPVFVEEPIPGAHVEAQADAMLDEIKRRLPPDTVYFVPWKWNSHAGLEFGLRIPDGAVPRSDVEVIRQIPFEHQLLEHLEPTDAGRAALRALVPDDQELICVFPRCRTIRRADKNWSREKYLELIRHLQSYRPAARVAVCGEPGGAYFADGVPDGCLDLINVAPAQRMDIQVAALQQSSMAVGSMSGAVLVALAAGCPTVIWGFQSSQARYHHENFMHSPLIYYADIDPPVKVVFQLVRNLWMMVQRAAARSESLAAR